MLVYETVFSVRGGGGGGGSRCCKSYPMVRPVNEANTAPLKPLETKAETYGVNPAAACMQMFLLQQLSIELICYPLGDSVFHI